MKPYLIIAVTAVAAGIAAASYCLTRGSANPTVAANASQPAATHSATAPTTTTETAAGVPMLYIYDAPESATDRRYEYQWEILQTALERTKAKWGVYRMAQSVFMSEERQAAELKSASGKLTVMYLGTTAEFERTLQPVRIPVDRNLGGYMVMLIRKSDQQKFRAVQSLDDLKQFRIGLGLGWLDVDILRHGGFNVVTGSSYDGLFDMLANNRFDAFSRAAVEILGEYDARKEKIPDLQIEDSFILYYPLPMYFWFSNTAEGKRLRDRTQEGMLAMYDDGTYLKIFAKYQQSKIDTLKLNLRDRKFFEIKNPNLEKLPVPFDDKRLWFDVKTGQ